MSVNEDRTVIVSNPRIEECYIKNEGCKYYIVSNREDRTVSSWIEGSLLRDSWWKNLVKHVLFVLWYQIDECYQQEWNRIEWDKINWIELYSSFHDSLISSCKRYRMKID